MFTIEGCPYYSADFVLATLQDSGESGVEQKSTSCARSQVEKDLSTSSRVSLANRPHSKTDHSRQSSQLISTRLSQGQNHERNQSGSQAGAADAIVMEQMELETVDANFPDDGSLSQVHRSQSHVHGSQSQVHGSQSQMHGSQSHVHRSQSHVHGSQSQVHGSLSLVHGSQSHVHGSLSHAHGSQTFMPGERIAIPETVPRTVAGDEEAIVIGGSPEVTGVDCEFMEGLFELDDDDDLVEIPKGGSVFGFVKKSPCTTEQPSSSRAGNKADTTHVPNRSKYRISSNKRRI